MQTSRHGSSRCIKSRAVAEPQIPGRPVEFCRSLQLNRLAPSDPEGFRTRLESPSLGWPLVLSSLLVPSPPGVRVHNFFVWGKGFAEDCRSTISPEERHVLPLRLSACPHPGLGPRERLRESTSPCVLAVDREENMSLEPTDKQDHHGSADTRAKRPYLALELKKLSPKAVLEWLESKSSSSDRATSEPECSLPQPVCGS